MESHGQILDAHSTSEVLEGCIFACEDHTHLLVALFIRTVLLSLREDKVFPMPSLTSDLAKLVPGLLFTPAFPHALGARVMWVEADSCKQSHPM